MAIRVPSPTCLWLAGTAALAALGCDATSSTTGTTPPSQPVPEIKTLSNRSDMISGGDALVEIVLPPGAKPDALHVTLGKQDVTSQFAVRANGRIIGLVTGLAEGTNALSADLGTGHGAFLKITNHKIGGPIFSGSQTNPFICATPTGTPAPDGSPANPSGLSGTASTDGQCNIAPEVRLFYRSNQPCTPSIGRLPNNGPDTNPDPVPGTPPANACFKLYNPASPPTDVAMTTTDAGVTMPFIVRVERGTLNRGIYDIAVLFDPTKDDVKAGWKSTAPQAGWNGKVLYAFGASSGQPRQQFHSEVAWADAAGTTNDFALGKGFLVAVNSMTDSLFNDNRVLMTETLMMMKEKIIDTYGEVRYVMGNGCSGGSINQLTAASIYPGLLDGIQPACTYPDSETTGLEVSDCSLLVNFYEHSTDWQTLMTGKTQDEINAKKAAINGHKDQTGCHGWVDLFAKVGRPGNFIDVQVTKANDTTGATVQVGGMQNNCKLPASMVYERATNPTGARCTVVDNAVSIFGTTKDADTGVTYARGTADNVGVQYGLKAFLSGAITPDEFVTLNEKIGGMDFDDNFTSTLTGKQAFARTQADPEALAIAYRAGLVSDAQHLAQVPIIDLRGYDDSRLNAVFGIHHEWRSFALRARLDAANGTHANHVMWRVAPALIPSPTPNANLVRQSFLTMDQWLTAMKSDTQSTSLASRIIANRPAMAPDFCFMSTDPGLATQIRDSAVCDSDPLLKPHASPRQVAGGPLAENILKCQLKPVDRNDYNPIGLTEVLFNRLKAMFPGGVCDFTKPGVGQQPSVGPLDFSAGPGGVPFADPPQQQAF